MKTTERKQCDNYFVQEVKLKLMMVICLVFFVIALLMAADKEVSAAENYTVITVSPTSGADAYSDIQDALDTARDNATSSSPYKVVVSSGSYKLSKTLHIYSNTNLYMQNVTITASSAENNMIVAGSSDDSQTGYCYSNITLEGGTWNGNGYNIIIFRAAHTSNLVLKDCTFKNVKPELFTA